MTKAATEPGARVEAAKGVFTAGHNIKGYAATFGFQLVTDIADSLCRLLHSDEALPPEAMALAEQHLDQLGSVIANELEGDGGEAGRAILAGLVAAVDKFDHEAG